MASRIKEENLNVEHQVVKGDPVKQILRLAGEIKPDLIVMGTDGQTGWLRWFKSSVTEQALVNRPALFWL